MSLGFVICPVVKSSSILYDICFSEKKTFALETALVSETTVLY